MPIVTIQITREGTTRRAEGRSHQGCDGSADDVLNKPPGLTFVVIQEVELEDWGVGGLPAAEYRRQLRRRHPVSRSDNAFSISLRRRATNSAAGIARASGAPCPAHWAPYPNSPAAFAAACSAFPAS